MNERQKHRFKGKLREWFRLLVKMGLLSKKEAAEIILKSSLEEVTGEEADEN